MASSLTNNNTHVKTTNIKRLQKFIKELETDKSDYFDAKPSNDDITVWYVRIYNLADEYTDGEYYMKIVFTNEYPFKPPSYMMLTPSGRFEINKYICMSNTGYHADQWSPLWSLSAIINAMISFFYERQSVGISHINNSTEEVRKNFAQQSKEFNQKNLKKIIFT